MARRHLKSPQSLSGRSSHLTLVTKWSWSWMTYSHLFVQCQLALPLFDTAISKFDHENPWSRPCVWSKVKVTFDLENSKVKVMAKVKPIVHIWGMEFMFAFCFVVIGPFLNQIFDLENSRSKSWPRSNPMVTFEALSSIDIFAFSFPGNWTIFGWDIANSIFDLKILRSRSWPKSNPMVTFKAKSSINVCFLFRGNETIFGRDIANSIFDLENSRSRSWRKSTKI